MDVQDGMREYLDDKYSLLISQMLTEKSPNLKNTCLYIQILPFIGQV